MNTEIVSTIRATYLEAVLDGDSSKAEKIIDQGLAGGIIPSKLYLDVLMPTQQEIGTRWHKGQVTIPQEHVATQITLSQMARLRTVLKTRLKLGLRAVVTSVEGDHHLVGGQAVADFLVMDGWEVDFMGANLPAGDLAQYIKARGAHLLCISVTLADNIVNTKKMIDEVKKASPTIKIIVGGLAFSTAPGLLDKLGHDGFAHDPHEAVTVARQQCGVLSSENSLALFLRKLGQSVHEYRKMRGMSQQELAHTSDLDRAYISAVEHGKQNISIGAISKLAKALSISIEELLIGTGH